MTISVVDLSNSEDLEGHCRWSSFFHAATCTWSGSNPTLGSEIRTTRPCLVIAPDELDEHLRAVIAAPMTTGGHAYPWRIACRFQSRSGLVALDQLRTVDRERLVKRLGRLSIATTTEVFETLQEMFAEQAPQGNMRST